MPDVNSIPFRQANGNGHYESKQLPNDNTDFLAILGLPVSLGNVTSVTTPSRDGQLVQYWQTGGLTIKGSTAIGVVDLVDGVVTTRLSPAGDIVGTLGAQTLTGKTLVNTTVSGTTTGLTKSSVGLGNVDNTSDAAKPISTAEQTALNLKEDKANKNVANGYAGLDAGGKVLAANLPSTVQGTVSYQGTWNATTNVPAIPAASAGNKGWYYVVSVAGTVSVSGVADWGVGDWLVSNGTSWDKIDNTDAVASVAGRTGAVVLAKADVGLPNVDNTSDDTKNSAAAVLSNKIINGSNNTLTVRLDQDVANNLPVVRLNNGIGATSQTWWCGDGQWKSPAGAGDVVGPAGAADGEFAIFSGATGKLLKRGSPQPTGVIVGTIDVQQLTNKSFVEGPNIYRVSGVILVNTTNAPEPAGGGPLHTTTIPANTLAKDGDALRFTSLIVASPTATVKNFSVSWAGTNVHASTSIATNNTHHVITTLITRTSATVQKVAVSVQSAVWNAATVVDAVAGATSGALVHFIGAGGGLNEMAQRETLVEFLPSP